MVVSHERVGATSRLRVTGDVDLATARALEHELDLAFRSGASLIELDLDGASFWDGSAFEVLAEAGRRAERDAIPLVVVGVSSTLRRVLDLTDLTDVGRAGSVDDEAC